MAKAKQMKMIETELERVRREIEKLRVEESLLVKMLAKAGAPAAASRTRSPSVKPLVLDIMRDVAERGATTQEVDALVREKISTVAKDTVGSVLSRLKGDGVLAYVGERYYEKRFTPKGDGPFERGLRAVN